MADLTSGAPTHGQRRGLEFNFYFAIILVAAIPFTSVSWVRDVVRRRTLNLSGPLARAWQEADNITPLIFSTR